MPFKVKYSLYELLGTVSREIDQGLEGDITELVNCPVVTCSFDGAIPELAAHIRERDDDRHTWDQLGYEGADEYRHDRHREIGRQLQTEATDARNQNQFDTAITKLEQALHQFQQAKLFATEKTPLEDQCRTVLKTIDDLEIAAQRQAIDDLVDRAENAIDAGDNRHVAGETDATTHEYEKAIEARTVAEKLESDHAAKIEQHLRRVRVRQQSLDLSGTHQTIRDLVREARDHATTGDQAFHHSKYDDALKEYEKANDRYHSLAAKLDEFSFGESTTNSNVCDICQHRFDTNLDSWQIDLAVTLHVCPACARFGPNGNLPSPRDVAAEQRAVKENIESIREGEVGLAWTSDNPLQSDTPDENYSEERDTQQMIVQLVGLCQQLGKVPSAEQLDEHTDFGYLAYRDEFGSISESLHAAGFDS